MATAKSLYQVIIDHPRTALVLTLIGFGLACSPRTSGTATWLFFAIALLIVVHSLWTQPIFGQTSNPKTWKVLLSLLSLVVVAGSGIWLTSSKVAAQVSREAVVVQKAEPAQVKPQTSPETIPEQSATPVYPPFKGKYPTLEEQAERHRLIYKQDKEKAEARRLSELYRTDHKLSKDSFIEPNEVRWVNEQLATKGMSYKYIPPPYRPPAIDGICKTSSEASQNEITYAPGVGGFPAISIPASDCNKANGNKINNPNGAPSIDFFVVRTAPPIEKQVPE